MSLSTAAACVAFRTRAGEDRGGASETELAETQAAEEEELTRLREELEHATADLERAQTTVTDRQASQADELARLREAHGHGTAELERLQVALAEVQAISQAREQALAEQQEQHAREREELIKERDGLRKKLTRALKRIARVKPTEQERDELRKRVEQLRASQLETQEASAEGLRKLAVERDGVMAELADAQAIVEEQLRLLEEERERHTGERESFVTQRNALEEQLAQAAAVAQERGLQIRRAAERLHHVFDEEQEYARTHRPRLGGVGRRLVAKLTPGKEAPEAIDVASVPAEPNVTAYSGPRDSVIRDPGPRAGIRDPGPCAGSRDPGVRVPRLRGPRPAGRDPGNGDSGTRDSGGRDPACGDRDGRNPACRDDFRAGRGRNRAASPNSPQRWQPTKDRRTRRR